MSYQLLSTRCPQGSVIVRHCTHLQQMRRRQRARAVHRSVAKTRLFVYAEIKEQNSVSSSTKHPPRKSRVEESDDSASAKLNSDSDKEPSRRPSTLLQLLVKIVDFFAKLKRKLSRAMTKKVFYSLLLFGALFGSYRLSSYWQGYSINVLYSEFVKQVDAGLVTAVYFESRTQNVHFVYESEMWDKIRAKLIRKEKLSQAEAEHRMSRTQPTTKVVPGQIDSLTQLLKRRGVKFGVTEQSMQSVMHSVFSTMFWLWAPLVPLLFLARRLVDSHVGQKSGSGRSVTAPHVRFSDVAGMDGAKIELLEVVELLKDPMRYARLNAKVPAGVLLSGPTGTGKTLLARAVAGEAGVPFFAVSASEFVELFVGRGAARIRALFKEARQRKPCVVFIDEIDAVGGIRGTSSNDERDQTLNQLLVELDGFENNTSVVLLAATNRYDVLDPALLRPGRLTRKVNVALPDAEGRAAILGVHLREVPMDSLEEKIDACAFIGRLAVGFSGAELANAVNEAALMAARENREMVEVNDLIKGLQRTKQPVNSTTAIIPRWMANFEQTLIEQTWKQSKRQRRQLPQP